ncbi:MAG TPA: glycosyltransferase family 4 protein [Gemmatimonadales bacterium]|nr:glycosyltransferase family 4 protein [Gemmatimonadales bacterium]
MRVWLITVGEPLPLPGRTPRLLRTGLLADELVQRGHQVTWWTSHVDHYAKQYFPGNARPVVLDNGVELRFLRGVLYRRNVSLARLVNHRQLARDFRVQRETVRAPDVILCSLPTIELARAASAWGSSHGIPVLIDVRDLWPDVLAEAVATPLRPLARIALMPLYREARAALRDCTGIIGISRGYLDWALRLAGRTESRHDGVVPLGYPRLRVSPTAVAAARERLKAGGVRFERRLVWFVGSFGRTYDLFPLLEAGRMLADAGPEDVQIVISGDGEDSEAYRRAAAGLENVVFTGWLEPAALAVMLQSAAIGVAAYRAGAPQGLPNKLFEYLSGGIPVISSLQGEARDLIGQLDCGMSYDPREPRALARAIREMLSDEPGRRRKAANARRAFEERYSSERVCAALVARIESARA